ncbi:MAG: BTAD domain-containing putative transcriptional regulator [Burkholderiales bacterium]
MTRRSALPAKLTRPRMHAPVLRERVFRQLDESRDHAAATWVDGPPGCGKTTAVATWLDARGIPFHWYQVDATDEDPATVFYFLAELARAIAGRRGTGLPLLSAAHRSDLAGFTRRFFRRFVSLLPDGCILVLDNVHEVNRGGILDVLREALGELPPGMAVVAISRQPAPATLARLAAGEQLRRIDWETLRFRLDESRALVDARSEGSADAAALHERSGGWAAGLVLLSRQSRDEAPNSTAVVAPGPSVFDYFAGEILDRAPANVRQIMLRTALLPEISRDAAIALTGQIDAPEIIEALHRHQYFTDRRTGIAPSWRYHDLFREFLLNRLTQELDAAQLAEVRRRAAALLADTGAPTEAVGLYRQVGDWKALVALVRDHGSGMFATGRWQTLAGWFEGMPEPVLRQDPWALFWWASCRVMVDPREAQAALDDAFDAFAAQGDETGEFFAAQAQTEIVFVLGESFRPLDRWIDVLGPMLERGRPFDSVAAGMRAWSAFVHACICRRPEHPLSRVGVRYVLEHLASPEIDDTQRTAAATILVGWAHFAADETVLRTAVALLEKLVPQDSIAPVSRVWAGVWLCVIHYMNADFPACLRITEWTRTQAQRLGLDTMIQVSDIYRSYTLYQIGRRAEALELDARLIEAGDGQKMYTLAYTLGLDGLHQLHEGHAVRAAEQLARAIEGSRVTGFVATQAIWQAQRADALIDLGRLDEAEALMAATRGLVRDPNLRTFDAYYDIVEAGCALARHDRERALSHLRSALGGTRPWKQIAKLCWNRHRLPRLFSLALEAEIEVPMVRRLVRDWRIAPASAADGRWPWPVRVRTLGRFEVLLDDAPLTLGRKVPKRLLELLKSICALGGQDVPLARLADAMFPDQDADVAEDSMRVSLQRLRKLLGSDTHVTLRDGRVSLNPATVWVDAVAFRQAVSGASSDDQTRDALSLYAGPLLADDEAVWAIGPRESLRDLFLRKAARLAESDVSAGRWAPALHGYRRCADTDVLNESFCQGVLRCCHALGLAAEGETAYRRTEEALRATFGRAPGERTRQCLRTLLEGRGTDP